MSSGYDHFSSLMARRQFKKAASFAEERYFYENSLFWLNQQAYACNRAQDFEKALALSQNALQQDASNIFALMSAADALFGLRRYQEALAYYQEGSSIPKMKGRAEKGILDCYSAMNQWQELLNFLQTQDDPDKWMVYKTKALEKTNRIDQALELCRNQLKQKPEDHAILWEMTELEIRQKGLEAVLSQIERLASIPTMPAIYKEIYASLCHRAGKHDKALKTYSKMESTASPGNNDLRISRKKAFSLAKSGNEEEALPLFEELLKIDTKDIYVHSAYAAACSRIGQIQRGLDFYTALLKQFPSEKSLFGYRNRLKKRIGNP